MSIAERLEPDQLHASVRAFVDEVVLPGVAGWDRADELPDGVLARLVDLGLTGALVPSRYGGAGLGVGDLWPAWRVLSQGWISLTGAINPTNLATTLLVRHGTEAQRARWLPGIASGAILASFSITEPQAGSDLQRIETGARRADGGGLVLDGDKRWVAGGVSSDVVFLMAAVDGDDKPSCVILPAEGRDSPSWRLEEIDKLGVPIISHTGQTGIGAGMPGGAGIKLRPCNPMYLDDLAADFPTLQIIMAHPSVPWQSEAISIATHKANTYIDLSGWSPKYFAPELVRAANTMLRTKVLFGTDYPVIDPDKWVTEFEKLEMKPEVLPLVLKENAAKLLGLA